MPRAGSAHPDFGNLTWQCDAPSCQLSRFDTDPDVCRRPRPCVCAVPTCAPTSVGSFSAFVIVLSLDGVVGYPAQVATRVPPFYMDFYGMVCRGSEVRSRDTFQGVADIDVDHLVLDACEGYIDADRPAASLSSSNVMVLGVMLPTFLLMFRVGTLLAEMIAYRGPWTVGRRHASPASSTEAGRALRIGGCRTSRRRGRIGLVGVGDRPGTWRRGACAWPKRLPRGAVLSSRRRRALPRLSIASTILLALVVTTGTLRSAPAVARSCPCWRRPLSRARRGAPVEPCVDLYFYPTVRVGEADNPGPAHADAAASVGVYDPFDETGLNEVDDYADYLRTEEGFSVVHGGDCQQSYQDVWDDPDADAFVSKVFYGEVDSAAHRPPSYVHDQPAVEEVDDAGYTLEELQELVREELEWERSVAEGSTPIGLPEFTNVVQPTRNVDGGIVVPQDQVDLWSRDLDEHASALASKYARVSKLYAERAAADRAKRSGRPHRGTHLNQGTSQPCALGPSLGQPILEEELVDMQVDDVALSQDMADAAAARAASLRSPTNRPRGRRRRKAPAPVEIWSINSSGRPQLLAAISRAQSSSEREVCAILSQEHQARGPAVADLQADCRALSWRIAATSATAGHGGGPSAGVGVATPAHVPSGLRPGWNTDVSPKGCPGRIAVQWIQAVLPSGVLCISVYLFHSEGPSPRNLAILDQALATARISECIWCLALDANQAPEELLAWAAPLVQRSDGKVVAPDSPTHYPSVGQAKTIDFFIMHRALATAVDSVHIVDIAAAKPHRVVGVRFKPCDVPRLQTVLKTPRKFPRHRPVGCGRAPVAPPHDFAEGIVAAAGEEQVEQAVSECWAQFVGAMEAELCGITDSWRGDAPDQRWCGRGSAAEYVQVPILPSRTSRELGKVDQRGIAYLWAENRLRELASLAHYAARQGPLTGARLRQWLALVGKFTSPSSAISHIRAVDHQWDALAFRVARYVGHPALAGDFLTAAANWAQALVIRRKKAKEAQLARSWAAFKKKQCRD